MKSCLARIKVVLIGKQPINIAQRLAPFKGSFSLEGELLPSLLCKPDQGHTWNNNSNSRNGNKNDNLYGYG